MRLLSCFLLLSFVVQLSTAQQSPPRWGEVPIEDLELTSIPADTAASVIILYDGGEVYHDVSGILTLDRHVRVKVLTEAGIDRANVSLAFRSSSRQATISNVRGVTYNLEDGKIERTNLERRAVFSEDLGHDLKSVRFTLPQVRTGSVYEFRYRQRFEYRHALPSWHFQTDEPTRMSHFTVRIPDVFHYVTQTRGFVEIGSLSESRPGTGPLGSHVEHVWLLENIPALRTEPFMTTTADYLLSLRFQPSAYRRADGRMQPFLNTWESAAEVLEKDPNFGAQLGRHRAIRSLAGELIAGLETISDRIEAIHRYVSRNIEWDGRRGSIFPSRAGQDVLRASSGTSNEINLLFISLLHAAGIEADAILISTRDHGAVVEMYPILDQFNYVLAGVQVDDVYMVLDATSDVRPMNLLPMAALSHRGWVVDSRQPRWIDINPQGRFRRQTIVIAQLDENGTLEGDVVFLHREYAAVSARAAIKGTNVEDYVRETLFKGLVGAEHAEIDVENLEDLHSPVSAKVKFRVRDYAMVAGDMMYVNLRVFNRLETNPLRLPERSFPIDMGYESDETYAITISLPDGYEVVDAPANVALHIPDQKAVFQQEATQFGNSITQQSRFVTADAVLDAGYYPYLRELYSAMVSAGNDQYILRRSSIDAADALVDDATDTGEGR